MTSRWNIIQRTIAHRQGWFPDPARFCGTEVAEPPLLKFVPPLQRPAIELAAWLRIRLDQVAALRPGDITVEGLRVGRRLLPWPADLPRRLQDKVFELATLTDPKQRIFEGEKPLRRAAWDLRGAMQQAPSLLMERDRWALAPVAAKLPDFLVLGVPRSATTWLYEALSSHPDIYVPDTKEQEFFGDYLFHRGLNWYLGHFAARRDQRLAGDVSVNYFNSEEAPAQVAGLLGPRAKLIVSLREPIARAQSYYNIRLPRGMAPASFDEAITLPFFHKLCIEHGHYVRFLRNWYHHFDPAQILILLYEDIRRDPAGSLRRVCTFLGVDAERATVPPRENRGHAVTHLALHRQLCRTAADLDVLLPGPLAALGAAGGRLLRRIDARLCLSSDRAYEVGMSATTERRLRDLFAPSNDALASLTGLDLSAWAYEPAVAFRSTAPLRGASAA